MEAGFKILEVKPIQSPNDKNEYRIIQLKNNLDCILISNPETDKAAASLAVNVGQYDDPEQREGLAHFLEHMLFLGTEKYPIQNNYDSYLSDHSGENNAYTDILHTNYYFALAHDALEGALDRFGQFFIKPLFSESCTEREINAVNSENEMAKVNDQEREYHIRRLNGLKGHPYARFGCGSLKTLQRESIRSDLLKFHAENYSAEKMKLVIFGKDNLDTLQKWAVQIFSDIKNNNSKKRPYIEPPYNKTNLGNFWYITPLKDHDFLVFIWVLPDIEKHYKNHPFAYLSHLFGHEGENSLLSLLKDEDLATALTTSYYSEMKTSTNFKIKITLTPKGFENYTDIISHTFRYLKLLKEDGVHKWIFDEIKKVCDLNFRFKELEQPINLVESLASSMLYYPYEDLLRKNYLMEEYNEDLLRSTIKSLTLENVRIQLTSKKVEKYCNQEDEWYNVKHASKPFDQEIIELYENPNRQAKLSKKRLGLPIENIFLPNNLEILSNGDEEIKRPVKIYENEYSEVWFKKDDKFLVPKAKIIMKIYFNNSGYGYSLDTCLKSKLWVEIFKEHLRETLYLASMAEFKFSFSDDDLGYRIDISGYSDTIHLVFKEVFKKLTTFNPCDYRIQFDAIRHEFEKKLENIFKGETYYQALQLREVCLKSFNFFHPLEQSERLKHIKFDDLLDFHRELFSSYRLEVLATGNLYKQTIIDSMKFIEASMKEFKKNAIPLRKQDIPQIRMTDLPINEKWAYHFDIPPVKSDETVNSNCCYVRYCQFGRSDNSSRLLSEILYNFLREPFYTQLRTNEQLGYCVWNVNMHWRGVLGMYFLVQSDVKSPQHISDRVEIFLNEYKKKFEEMTEEEFKKYVDSIKNNKIQKDYTLFDESDRLWNAILEHDYEFDRKEKEVGRLDTLTLTQFKKFVLKTLYEERRILEVHVIAEQFIEENTKARQDRKEKEKEYVEFTDIMTFKNQMKLHPDYFTFRD